MNCKILLAILGLVLQAGACTTWICMPDSNEFGQILLHKNRDAGKGQRLPITLTVKSSPQGKYSWLQFCDSFYVNEKGFAVMNNALPGTTDFPQGAKRRFSNSAALMQEIAGNCSTVREVLEMLRGLLEPKDAFLPTSNYLLTDGKEAGMLELSAKHFAYHRLETGFAVHANDFIFPEMMQYSDAGENAMIKSAVRLVLTRDLLTNAIRKNGTLTIQENLAASRFASSEFPNQGTYRVATVCAATYVYDKEFPEMLGTFLVQCGPTDFAVAIPLAIGCRKIPAPFQEELGDLAFQMKFNVAQTPQRRQAMNDFEEQLWKEYRNVQEEARRLLRENKAEEARTLLENLLEKQAGEAKKFLTEKSTRQTPPVKK